MQSVSVEWDQEWKQVSLKDTKGLHEILLGAEDEFIRKGVEALYSKYTNPLMGISHHTWPTLN